MKLRMVSLISVLIAVKFVKSGKCNTSLRHFTTPCPNQHEVGPQRIVILLGRKIILKFQSPLIFRDGFSKLGISFSGSAVIVCRVGGGPFLVNQFFGASNYQCVCLTRIASHLS